MGITSCRTSQCTLGNTRYCVIRDRGSKPDSKLPLGGGTTCSSRKNNGGFNKGQKCNPLLLRELFFGQTLNEMRISIYCKSGIQNFGFYCVINVK
jgi:hypothetical protein